MNRTYNYNKDTAEFSYQISHFDNVTTSDYFEAVDKSLEDIFSEMSGLRLDKIAICLSGIDSEIIAQRLLKYKKNVEYWFLHIQEINDAHKLIVEKIAEKHKVKLNIVTTSINYIKDFFCNEVFDYCQLTMGTYVSVPLLIKEIPQDFYIIIGEGDLEKDGVSKYRTIFRNKIQNPSSTNIYVPVHLSEIVYDLSFKKYEKYGESNFYSRKFDTWYHVLKDYRLITNYRFFYDPKSDFISELCGQNFISPDKTLNFIFSDHKVHMRDLFSTLSAKAAKNWIFPLGDVITIPKDIIF